MKIVADDRIPFLRGVFERMAEVAYWPGDKIGPREVRDADALLTRTRTRCDAALLEGSRVKFIASATIGFDHIDQEYCRSRGIAWTNAEGCNAASVTQWVGSALATVAKWRGLQLQGKTLGIVGVGNVGRRVERLARTLGMQALRNDPPRARAEGEAGFVSLEYLIDHSDFITLHVPLTVGGSDPTFHLVDAALLTRFRTGAILLNSSRGEVLDSVALKSVLRLGGLGGAVVDVWENEPHIDRTLLELVTLGTPHIAGYSADGKANGTAMAVQALSRCFGLGLEDWYPAGLPKPAQPLLNIDCENRGQEEVLLAAILATYAIEEDDQRLRRSVESFEEQRGNYPLRREFSAYQVQLSNAGEAVRRSLEDLGFRVVCD
ncbi:MAG: 4-phosphoerythronate dehydrogenase PdxB [Acidobacteriota bacterium]